MKPAVRIFIFSLIFFPFHNLTAQVPGKYAGHFSEDELKTIVAFLSSDMMEGRETGTAGAGLASDFIALMMQNNGLEPFGDPSSPENNIRRTRSYFNNFGMIRYKTITSRLTLLSGKPGKVTPIEFAHLKDYICLPVAAGSSGEAPVVFAGYGISRPDRGYDDYAGVDAKGKIAVVLKGFPGCRDSTSFAWKKLGRSLDKEDGLPENKLVSARSAGAIGVIYINSYSDIYHHIKDININTFNDIYHPDKEDKEYSGGEYILENDTIDAKMACFITDSIVSDAILSSSGIDPWKAEAKIAGRCKPQSVNAAASRIRFAVTVRQDRVKDRNVIGILYGADTSKYIVVGAHYDHLGIRNGLIYNGADDNASGVAGMIGLAKSWAACGNRPSCNMIFAAWAAEEKGQLGSRHFALNPFVNQEKILTVFNMDMISRSAPEDTTGRIVSVGTRPESENLRAIAAESNKKLSGSLIIDLWDVTGHSGSDYNYFSRKGVPVMTFFSGYNPDYHTTRDKVSRIDPSKMVNILNLVNQCISSVLKSEYHQ